MMSIKRIFDPDVVIGIFMSLFIVAAIFGVFTDFGNDLGEQDCRPVTKVYVCNRYGCRVNLEGNERGTTTGLVAVGDRVCQRRSSGGWYLED
jgi:hypothetical protein